MTPSICRACKIQGHTASKCPNPELKKQYVEKETERKEKRNQKAEQLPVEDLTEDTEEVEEQVDEEEEVEEEVKEPAPVQAAPVVQAPLKQAVPVVQAPLKQTVPVKQAAPLQATPLKPVPTTKGKERALSNYSKSLSYQFHLDENGDSSGVPSEDDSDDVSPIRQPVKQKLKPAVPQPKRQMQTFSQLKAAESSSTASRRDRTITKQKQKTQQTESTLRLGEINVQEEVNTERLLQDLNVWTSCSEENLVEETFKLIQGNINESASRANPRIVRMRIAAYRASLLEKKGQKIKFRNRLLTMTEFIEMALNAEKGADRVSAFYNQLKAGRTWEYMLLSGCSLENLPPQTIASHLSAAAGRTDGTTKPNKLRMFANKKMTAQRIPELYDAIVEHFKGRNFTAPDAKKYIDQIAYKPNGQKKNKKVKPEPKDKDEIIKQQQDLLKEAQRKFNNLKRKYQGDEEDEDFVFNCDVDIDTDVDEEEEDSNE